MHFSQLEKITSGELLLTEDLKVNYFSTDTRTLSGNANEVFIAIDATRDGHGFIQGRV